MNKIDVFKIPFYQFKAEKTLNDRVLEDLKSRQWRSAFKPEYGELVPNYYNKELFDFFNNSLNEFKDVYFEKKINLPIADCWANRYTKLTRLNKHSHSNAVICGVYYATTHKDANTIWEMPNPWTEKLSEGSILWITKRNVPHVITGEVSPEAGTLVLFPPQLNHYMNTYKNFTETRYTVAFNCFVSGEVSKQDTGSLIIGNPGSIQPNS